MSFVPLSRRLPVTAKEGALPTAKLVVGKLDELTPAILAPVPAKLFEKVARDTGMRLPTKKVAGWPSLARRRMRRPWRTIDSIRAKFAEAPGMVAAKVVRPPP